MRAPSSLVMIASYSAPPIETVLIDFTQPVMVSLELQMQNGDTGEVLHFALEISLRVTG